MLKTMSAATRKYAAIRFETDTLLWRITNGEIRRERTAESQTAHSVTRGLILLFSVQTAKLLCVLAEGPIRNIRVGASAGLAAEYLVKKGEVNVGVLGSGFMASAHIDAITLIRKINSLKIFSPSADRRTRFRREIISRHGIEAEEVNDAKEAVQRADLVILATNALRPVIDASWMKPGMHITCVRHCEISKDGYNHCDTIVLNSKKNYKIQHYLSQPRIDVGLPRELLLDYEMGFPPGNVTNIDWDTLPDLPDLLLGLHPGRSRDSEITCFNNSVGLGLQFAASGGAAYETALKMGLGSKAPDFCFPDVA